MTILLCVPAFNEENVIGDVIKKSLEFVDHVVVYDDGSSDKTSEIAENAGAYVIRNSQNKGKGYALRKGLEVARGEHIMLLDSDLEYDPKDCLKMFRIIKTCKLLYDSNFGQPDNRLHPFGIQKYRKYLEICRDWLFGILARVVFLVRLIKIGP